MKAINVTYAQFKDLVATKGLLGQYVENSDSYMLFAVESTLSWEASILKDGGIDVVEFETDLKSTFNKPLEHRSADGLLKMAPSKFVESLNLWVDGENGVLDVASGETKYSKTHFTTPYTLAGVDAKWDQANLGDYLDIEVGFYMAASEAAFVSVNKFGHMYRILGSGSRLFDVPTVKTVPPSVDIGNGVIVDLYIRVKCVNVGPSASKVVVNLVGWK